ncbi:MAG: excinuclease ABC subunit UvrC [Gammaproteobacteria bacterium]|nr:excinuclease ABC subunit UvrC [Gammaproteobacteria bacterium]NNC56500.1 excinuclease ABC subunit UvrC [Woeseiaceae bacterium]NNL51487.1 excinuclease ABC subunit UvrC [Woeseiaceae bacterium]
MSWTPSAYSIPITAVATTPIRAASRQRCLTTYLHRRGRCWINRHVSDEAAFEVKPFLRSLTHRPGVYLMLDARHKVIYVGKARDLKKRVSSYFNRTHAAPKTAAMMEHVARVEVTVANTEAEALILEYSLIKRHKPRYNVLLRDDKSYPYIYASTNAKFPRLKFHRGPRRGKGRYFGPYPSTRAVRKTLNELEKLFLIRNCSDSFFSNRTRPCLQYQIKRCTAPCVDLISEEQYRKDIDAAVQFLEGKNKTVVDTFVRRMEKAAAAKDYEHAARYRDQIARLKEIEARQLMKRSNNKDLDILGFASNGAIHCVTVMFIRNGSLIGSRDHFPRLPGETDKQKILNAFVAQYYLGRDAPAEIVIELAIDDADLLQQELTERVGHKVAIRSRVRGDRARWLQMARANAEQGLSLKAASNATIRRQFASLSEALSLDEPAQRLECFDVSHTSGEATVASCVVFNTAGPVKSDYRRFNLSPAAGGDDYAAMAEALRRRYQRVKKGEVPTPDILFVDGGKGQLAQAMTVLNELELDWLTVIAVAKGRARRAGAERLFRPGESRALELAPDSPALLLVQQIRDEAHRFAIFGHRQRRAKARTTSRLERIPGLGPKKRRELLRQFGGLQGVIGAGVDDLVRVRGISRTLAETIYNNLHVENQ